MVAGIFYSCASMRAHKSARSDNFWVRVRIEECMAIALGAMPRPPGYKYRVGGGLIEGGEFTARAAYNHFECMYPPRARASYRRAGESTG